MERNMATGNADVTGSRPDIGDNRKMAM